MTADWLAVDWGTSNLRLWAMTADGQPIAERRSDRGMGNLSPEEFEGVLVELAGDFVGHDTCDVLICGMAGAKQGWIEARYVPIPGAPISAKPTKAPAVDPRLNVHILPGMSQDTPVDVMRGEETQITGLLSTQPGYAGAICLPGTHSKWAHVEAGRVLKFRSFMTGELFALLTQHSILAHSVQPNGWNEANFMKHAMQGFRTPGDTFAALFPLRAGALMGSEKNIDLSSAISGLLIGTELAGALPFWRDNKVTLIGDKKLSILYVQVLERLDQTVTIADPKNMTLAGLVETYHQLKKEAYL